MKSEEAFREFEALDPEEKKHYNSFEDYLGANALCICETCDEVVEYDEVDENGDCLEHCSEEEC